MDPSSRANQSLAPFRIRPLFRDADDSNAIRLTDRQREELVNLGTRLQVRPRTMIYLADAPAEFVFVVTEGVVKSYRELASGKPLVYAFLFSRDLFGLAEAGRYVNAARAITDVTLYRLPMTQLAALLKQDAELQYVFLTKVTHELRESQRRTILLNRPDAAGRLAMFLAWMADRTALGDQVVALPMTRSDIAAFLGLTLESVSRAARTLERRGLVAFEGRHAVRIVDEPRLAALVAAV